MSDQIAPLPRPDVRVFQNVSAAAPTLRRPLLEAAVIAQCFQIETRIFAGQYDGVAVPGLAYPGIKDGALVDDLSADHPSEPDLLSEVVVEIEDVNGRFDVTNDDETVIEASGITLRKALTIFKTMLSGTIVTTGEEDTEVQFPSSVSLQALGVRIGDKLAFATQVDDLVDPARSIPSSEVDDASGLPILFDITAMPDSRTVRLARLGDDWDGLVGEARVQAEIRRYPAGTGVLVAPQEDGAGIDLTATSTLTIVNAEVDFLSDPVQPGDTLEWTDDIRDIVGVAETIIDNADFSLTTIPGGEGASTGLLGEDTPILAGTTFTDIDGPDFDDEGVDDDGSCFLEFVTEEEELSGSDGVVSVRNLSRYQIIGVAAEALTLAKPLVSEAPASGKSFQYRVVRMNQPVAVANNKKPFTVLQVLGPQSFLLDRAMSVEARSGSREFEFSVKRSGVPNGEIRVSYRALRTDLIGFTEVGADSNGGTQAIIDTLGPISVKNPLALMASFAALNTPFAVGVVGVAHYDEESVAKALEVLGAQDVYSIVLASLDPALNTLVQDHVNQYSDPLGFAGFERRTYGALDFAFQDVRIETQDGDDATLTVESDRSKLSLGGDAEVTFLEVHPNDIIDFDPDNTGRTVAFDIGGNKILRSQMQIISNLGGETFRMLEDVHADEGGTISGPWKVLSHVYSKDEVAQNVARTHNAMSDRRRVAMFPPYVKAPVGGVESVIPTYYYAAAVAGKRSAVSPSKPLTNEPIAGFSGTVGGQGVFSEQHFAVMAGGGTWVLLQATSNAPVVSRHQLTTDVTSVFTREDSKNVAADFSAKFLRLGFKDLIGKENIDDDFIKQEARPRLEALVETLKEDKIIDKQSSVLEFGRHPQKPDGLRAVIDLRTPFPFNFGDFVLNLT